MDGPQFDAWTRALTPSRRSLLSGVLAMTAGWPGVSNIEAKKKRKKKKKKEKVEVCLNGQSATVPKSTAGAFLALGATLGPCPPAPTCSDGIQNGSETGVDCGGTCPPCAIGQGCATASDCASALCTGGTCQTCVDDPSCGSDADGPCICRSPDAGGSSVCVKNSTSSGPCESSPCPAGTMCINNVGMRICFKPCGAV